MQVENDQLTCVAGLKGVAHVCRRKNTRGWDIEPTIDHLVDGLAQQTTGVLGLFGRQRFDVHGEIAQVRGRDICVGRSGWARVDKAQAFAWRHLRQIAQRLDARRQWSWERGGLGVAEPIRHHVHQPGVGRDEAGDRPLREPDDAVASADVPDTLADRHHAACAVEAEASLAREPSRVDLDFDLACSLAVGVERA